MLAFAVRIRVFPAQVWLLPVFEVMFTVGTRTGFTTMEILPDVAWAGDGQEALLLRNKLT